MPPPPEGIPPLGIPPLGIPPAMPPIIMPLSELLEPPPEGRSCASRA